MPEPREPLRFDTNPPALPVPPWLAQEAAALAVALDDGDAERLARFLALMLSANTLVNLTAITDPEEAWRRHILDAITLVPLLAELPEGARVADVGSGGGVPAIPLAICMPALRFTLIEATGKKAAFLRAAVQALELSNAEVICDRAETLGQDHRRRRESFDAATARALGPTAVAAELTLPLVRPGGIVLLVKGERAEQELAEAEGALRLLSGAHAGTLPTPTGRIVVLEKISTTPRTYPRPPGEPKRRPLRAE